MANFRRLAVLNTIIDIGLIPLFYEENVETAQKIVTACLEGGARCIEFTNRGAQALHVFEQLIRGFQDDPRLILGAGTIIDAFTASLYIQLGANFIVGPTLDEDIAYTCNRRKIAYLPGCGNVNDISQAEKLGAEICKLFPGGQIGGPAFIKTVLGPMPWSCLMPTGGVAPQEDNVREWFQAGAVCVGMGSNLITKEAVSRGDYQSITENVRRVLDWIREVRQEKSH